MTPPDRYLVTCPACGREHTKNQKNALYCDAECKKNAYAAGLKHEDKIPAISNPEWNKWRAMKREEQIYKHRKEVAMGTPFEPVSVPDSRGQADFHSGLMV